MIKTDERALMCDLAETYRIYDYKRLPPKVVAVFAVGLRDDSRIKMKMNDIKISPQMLMLASIVDKLNWLIWSKTKDAARGKNRPTSIVAKFIHHESDVTGFATGEDFIKERQRILKLVRE